MSHRIEICRLGAEHMKLAASWLADPQINRWLYSEWRERKIDERLVAVVANHPANRMWLITCEGEPYGICCVTNISGVDRSGTAWYLRGTGIDRVPGAMTRAVGEMVREAFSRMRLRSISASILEPNLASRRVLENNRFREAGRLRKAFKLNDGYVDRILFDLLPEDLSLGTVEKLPAD
jgi:RimJ/RimL family protein N-acetyltransferase